MNKINTSNKQVLVLNGEVVEWTPSCIGDIKYGYKGMRGEKGAHSYLGTTVTSTHANFRIIWEAGDIESLRPPTAEESEQFMCERAAWKVEHQKAYDAALSREYAKHPHPGD